ncbi:MAG: class I SAM-dependent methyltransferase [Desulfovibrio sp.]|uniref:class I SAM-dependent methyltransferase n=1 Tax=Desulfovibrio sp. TaxID=885 RepID=UPI0039E69047
MTTHHENFLGELPFGSLSDWLVAPVRMALLNLTLQLELPDILANVCSLSGIAACLKKNCGRPADESRLASLMDGMVAAGLACKNDGAYSNSHFAQEYLRKESPVFLGDLVASLTGMQHRNLACLRERLFAGEADAVASGIKPEIMLRDESHWKRSLAGLAAYQKAGAANALARLITELPGAEQFSSMLDLGCGPGITALRTAALLPNLHVTLCDFSAVLDTATAEAEASGMAGRVVLRPGDFNTVALGHDYDLVWACQSLYYATDLHEFLTRVCAALRPGGLFVSVHEGVREGVSPAVLVLSRLSLAMEGQDVSLRYGQMATAAAEAGLERIRVQSIPMLFGEADMEVFQKPCGANKGGDA